MLTEAELFRSATRPILIRNIKKVRLLPLLSTRVIAEVKKLEEEGWVFYIVEQSRGRCYYTQKAITIPLWATKRGTDYMDWYVCHEIAHAYAGYSAKHGSVFMEWLKRICPEVSIHFELTYKPRNATAAGITEFIEAPTKAKSLKEVLAAKLSK